ncbi:lyase family protein [Actinomycetota bacterium]
MPDHPHAAVPAGADLLRPGLGTAAVLTDADVVGALLRAEVAWSRALGTVGAASPESVSAIEAAAADLVVGVAELSAAAADGGNPVIPLVRVLRAAAVEAGGEDSGKAVHRGLTSQDVMDTALLLAVRDLLDQIIDGLDRSGAALARLADAHRETVMAGRTLGQHAVPITFGLKAAQWLAAVADAVEDLRSCRETMPVQCGGAVGTLAAADTLTGGRGIEVAAAWADELGLAWDGLPWHTRRTPLTRLGDSLVAACDALGKIAVDVLAMTRTEVGEVAEAAAPGRGGSSTMPHKRNPVQSVLLRSETLRAPLLGAQLHTLAMLADDERPTGSWHAEWPTLRELVSVASAASRLAAQLLDGLEVRPDAMRRVMDLSHGDLLAERESLTGEAAGTEPDYAAYLGQSHALIDEALRRWEGSQTSHD